MIIAITAQGTRMKDEVDPRFGRAPYILLFDSETGKLTCLDNLHNAQAIKGAGTQAAAMVGNNGADLVLTGYCGPKASKVLEKAGIRIVQDVTGTVEEAIATCLMGAIENERE